MNHEYSCGAVVFTRAGGVVRYVIVRSLEGVCGFPKGHREPGETEEEFEECRKFVEEINFYEMHVFKYSPRKGTVAAGMKDQLTDREKTLRSDVLIKLTEQQSEVYRNSFIGEKVGILWEDMEENALMLDKVPVL